MKDDDGVRELTYCYAMPGKYGISTHPVPSKAVYITGSLILLVEPVCPVL
jgi:hypothetical protein